MKKITYFCTQLHVPMEWTQMYIKSLGEMSARSYVLLLKESDGMRQVPIVIEYNYFFKDKNAVYQYHTGKEKLEKLSYNPQSFTEKSLLKLLNKEK